ncbi:MAG: HemK2/MTQ2 family protein methyltransferase [Candidatus Bathyarchaeia archaeon]
MPEKVYSPAEDSYLVAENLEAGDHETVIDIGSGSGLLAILASKKAERVFAIDINPDAALATHENAKRNGVSSKIDTIVGDMFQPFRPSGKFDRVVCNPPYLPTSDEEMKKNDAVSKAWSAGLDGRLHTKKLLEGVRPYLTERGSLTLVQSSLSKGEATIEKLCEMGFRVRSVTRRNFDFEILFCIVADYA